MHGPVQITRDCADQRLLSALQEAQSLVRAYDTKAQILGVGYILALNLVLHFGDLLPTHAPIGPLFFAAVWGIVIMPILQFGQVLYPSRTRAERELNGKMSGAAAIPPVYYVDPSSFADVRDLVDQALRSDWTSVLAAELLKPGIIVQHAPSHKIVGLAIGEHEIQIAFGQIGHETVALNNIGRRAALADIEFGQA